MDTDIRIQIFLDTDMNIFLTDMDMDTVWNLETDMDNYPDLKVLKFRIFMILKY
jgi:hypothetical protein